MNQQGFLLLFTKGNVTGVRPTKTSVLQQVV